ncbi:MAG: nickel-dependent hydrogenase large subunit [Desulfobacterales bacterium]
MGRTIDIFPVNRVEGDLEIRVELEDGVIAEARSVGTLYRGFENILAGRSALDGLVITPRICGICSTAHLMAAAKSLDMIYSVSIPDTARRIRNIALGVEKLQNDMRHSFLIFMCDFANPCYRKHSLYEEALFRYAPLKGKRSHRTAAETAKLIEIIAILGGQWPHSSFMVPGGVVSAPRLTDIAQCRWLLAAYRKWYESKVLGCDISRWAEVRNCADLAQWLEESDTHRESDMGMFLRFSHEAGLDKMGQGHGNFISFGSMELPENTKVASMGTGRDWQPSGFLSKGTVEPFDQQKIAEDISCSWFRDKESGPCHPFDSITVPYATGSEGKKYSWAKAPRYDGLPAETGPLAELLIARHPLFTDLVREKGPSVLVRQLARMVRPALLLPVLDLWLSEVAQDREIFFRNYREIGSGEGFGLTGASRGALGHWVKIRNEKIEKYQIISPTTWNASPRDGRGLRGPWEEALIGTAVADPENPVEVGHIIRSFDACLVCTVHAVRADDPCKRHSLFKC